MGNALSIRTNRFFELPCTAVQGNLLSLTGTMTVRETARPSETIMKREYYINEKLFFRTKYRKKLYTYYLFSKILRTFVSLNKY